MHIHNQLKSMKSTAPFIVLFAVRIAAQIECLKVGQVATAQWTNAEKQSCTWTGLVGSNFGVDAVNDGK